MTSGHLLTEKQTRRLNSAIGNDRELIIAMYVEKIRRKEAKHIDMHGWHRLWKKPKALSRSKNAQCA